MNDARYPKEIFPLMAFLLLGILLLHWLYGTAIIDHPAARFIFYRIQGRSFIAVKAAWLFCSVMTFASSGAPTFSKSIRLLFWVGIVAAGVFFYGYTETQFWNFYVYPAALLLAFLPGAFLSARLFSEYGSQKIFGTSSKRSNWDYVFRTRNGKNLRIPKPEQHLYIQAGSGFGKGDTWCNALIYQDIVQYGLPGVLHDFKGAPYDMAKVVYTAAQIRDFKLGRKKQASDLKVAFWNAGDLTRSMRINPISPRYLKTNLDVYEAASTLLLNFSEGKVGNELFWINSAISILQAVIVKLKNDHPDICSIPTVTELFFLKDIDFIFEFAGTNEEARKILVPTLLAREYGKKQFTSMVNMVQIPLTRLISSKLYWLLSADEVDLNINSIDNPTYLVLTNHGKESTAVSSVIALILSVALKQMNVPGRKPSAFTVDEIYTLYLKSLPETANNMRSNLISMRILNQEYKMLVDRYGAEKADNLIAACGTQIYGTANTTSSADLVARMFGERLVGDTSKSVSDGGKGWSQTYRIRKDKLMQIRDLMSMKTGEFVGKIADGRPPFFHERMHIFKETDYWTPVPPFALQSGLTEADLNRKIEQNYKKIAYEVKSLCAEYKDLCEESDDDSFHPNVPTDGSDLYGLRNFTRSDDSDD